MLRRIKHRSLAASLLGLTIALAPLGCHRGYYRRMADDAAQKLVSEKAADPRWQTPTGEIEIAPQSRMFDPFSKDHPPMPPDDPSANQFMNQVDGRKGYPHWHANGDTCYVENPEWKMYLPVDENGKVIVNIDSAIDLSLLHSPDLQQQREELYLSALDVSLERFGFDSQLFAGFNSFFETQGRFRGGGVSRSNWGGSLGPTGGGINYQKLGITGANFVVGLANSVIWNFAGPNTQTASSLINFSITQPLLRNAGRERIMESLTQAERTLLGNVRLMERFRQGFYLEIVTGRGAGPGPNRGGSFLSTPSSASTNAGGIIGLLQTQQQIRFAEFNVQQNQDSVERLQQYYLANQITSLQVQQAQISLYSAQQSLMNTKVNYQNSLDRFKVSLGIAPDVDLEIRDQYLDQFIMISDELLEQQNELNRLRRDFGEAMSPIDRTLDDFKDAYTVWEKLSETNPDDVNKKPELAADIVEQAMAATPFLEESLKEVDKGLGELRDQIENDIKLLEDTLPQRLTYLKKLRTQFESGAFDADIDPGILAENSIPKPDVLRERLNTSMQKLQSIKTNLTEINGRFDSLEDLRKSLANDSEFRRRLSEDFIAASATQLSDLNSELTELSLLQILARSNSIGVKDVDIDTTNAIEIARCFRLDWMNAVPIWSTLAPNRICRGPIGKPL
ncbi:MAG: hypothetical protein R3C03_20480 [Pirellulaceae bacterium]